MQALRRKSDNVILYTGDMYFMPNGNLRAGNRVVNDIDQNEVEIITVKNHDYERFSSKAYKYDAAGWGLVNEDRQPIPSCVSRVQFLIAIDDAGKTAALETLRDSAPVQARIRFDNEFQFERKSKIVELIRNGLSITGKEMDLLFKRASMVKDW